MGFKFLGMRRPTKENVQCSGTDEMVLKSDAGAATVTGWSSMKRPMETNANMKVIHREIWVARSKREGDLFLRECETSKKEEMGGSREETNEQCEVERVCVRM